MSSAEVLSRVNDSLVLDLNLTALMGTQLDRFWRYEGSLTVPPCTEGITWTIFVTPIVFEESDMDRIRKNLFTVNYRYPKPVFDRPVYRNFPEQLVSSISDYKCFPDNGDAHVAGFRMLLLPWLSSVGALFFIRFC